MRIIKELLGNRFEIKFRVKRLDDLLLARNAPPGVARPIIDPSADLGANGDPVKHYCTDGASRANCRCRPGSQRLCKINTTSRRSSLLVSRLDADAAIG
jgi:hypothetical protein